MMPVFAVIDLASPICKDVVRIFGTRHLPLVNSRLVRNSAPGTNETFFFLVDWTKFTEKQIGEWAEWMSRRFALSKDLVLQDLKDPAHGMPLLETHVISLDPPDTVIERPRLRSYPGGPIDMRMLL